MWCHSFFVVSFVFCGVIRFSVQCGGFSSSSFCIMRTHSGFPNLQRAWYVKFPVVTFTTRLHTNTASRGGQSVQFEYAAAVADGLVINTFDWKSRQYVHSFYIFVYAKRCRFPSSRNQDPSKPSSTVFAPRRENPASRARLPVCTHDGHPD